MIRNVSTAFLAAALLAGCVAGSYGSGDRYDRLLTARAEPSKVVATELAFARAAQEKGQWTAFAEYSTDDAVMFVPQVTNAHTFLKGRADPPKAVAWQPHEVWSSCDGSLAVTKGAWQRPDGSVGYFTTVWQRQKDGEYKWVLDQGDALKEPLAAPEFVQTHVAQCDSDSAYASAMAGDGGESGDGSSDDGTLQYSWTVAPDGSRSLNVSLIEHDKLSTVLDIAVPAPAE